MPPQRGSLGISRFVPVGIDKTNATQRDYWAHFPAGNKSDVPGSGQRSQIAEAGPKGWTPFEPFQPNFHWRAGVCGDQKGYPQHHKRGGIYYNGGLRGATYIQGGIVKVALSIIAHHNGYIRLSVCDIKKCGGDINESCFRKGFCRPLERAKNSECDGGMSKRCGPIDRNHRERWYLPCSTVPDNREGWEIYGPETILFRLPTDLVCDHCVIQWFWTSANSCNPPGIEEYFEGPDGPRNWGSCPGQGGAIGGRTTVQKPCRFDDFPEEYLQCADVRIKPRKIDPTRTPSPKRIDPTRTPSPKKIKPTRTPSPLLSSSTTTAHPDPTHLPKQSKMPYAPPRPSITIMPTKEPRKGGQQKKPKISTPYHQGTPTPTLVKASTSHTAGPAPSPEVANDSGVIRRVVLFADGKPRQLIEDFDRLDIKPYNRVTFLVHCRRRVKNVRFFLNNDFVWAEFYPPYFFYGNKPHPFYWKKPILNDWFKLTIVADGEEVVLHLRLV